MRHVSRTPNIKKSIPSYFSMAIKIKDMLLLSNVDIFKFVLNCSKPCNILRSAPAPTPLHASMMPELEPKVSTNSRARKMNFANSIAATDTPIRELPNTLAIRNRLPGGNRSNHENANIASANPIQPIIARRRGLLDRKGDIPANKK